MSSNQDVLQAMRVAEWARAKASLQTILEIEGNPVTDEDHEELSKVLDAFIESWGCKAGVE